METKERTIERLISGLEFQRYPQPPTSGGQSTGFPHCTGVILTCGETDFQIRINWHRSQLENRETAVRLYREFLEGIL